ncbi:MAG TPA: nucleotidyltransferase family protein [Methylomirabilota bacterium]|nr:nucleotidyltransferase family protein [Methylomirabilota bacterium]
MLTAATDRGERVSALLAGAWRPAPPAPTLTEDAVADLVPLLIKTGAGALAWWRLRAAAPSGPTLRALHQAYRAQTLDARLHEERIARAIGLLRRTGIEPLLIKGWAAARLYPHAGLRPYGDIDLVVRHAERARAAAALSDHDGQTCRVDLHDAIEALDTPLEALFERSRLVKLGDLRVRVPGAEDHLVLLCLHMLRHGAWRPVWLCDVAAAVEALGPDAVLTRSLPAEPRRAHWVACALGLAERLLEARVPAHLGAPPPAWLTRAVLEQWARDEHYMHGPSMSFALRRPRLLADALRLRWPNAIQATVELGGAFNDLPRLPFQVGECVRRIGHAVVTTCTR